MKVLLINQHIELVQLPLQHRSLLSNADTFNIATKSLNALLGQLRMMVVADLRLNFWIGFVDEVCDLDNVRGYELTLGIFFFAAH